MHYIVPKFVEKCLEECRQDYCCVYWIHSPHHEDITKQGYVGVTNNPRKRYLDHRSLSAKVYSKSYKYGVTDPSTIFEVIIVGNRESCLDLEYRCRPKKKIGWNLAIGGQQSNLIHGLTGTFEFDTYRRFKRKAKKRGVIFQWDGDEVGFCEWYKNLNPDNKPTKLINVLKGYVEGNIVVVDTLYEALTHLAKTVDYEGNTYTIKQLAENLEISYPALYGRLLGGRTLEESAKRILETVRYKGKVISREDYEDIIAPYSSLDDSHRKEIIRLHEDCKLPQPVICEMLGLSTHQVRYFLLESGLKTRKKVLKGLNGKDIILATWSKLTQEVLDEFLTLKIEGYLDKEVKVIMGVSASFVSYLRSLVGWDNKYIEGRYLTCADGTKIIVKGERAISQETANLIISMKNAGHSDTSVGEVIGRSRRYVSDWKNKLKWGSNA